LLYQFIVPYWDHSLSSFENIIWFIIAYLIFFGIITLLLIVGLGMFNKSERTELLKVSLTTIIITLCYAFLSLFIYIFISWIITLIISIIMINLRHRTGFLNAILVTIIIFLIYFMITFILGLMSKISLVIPIW
jgi:hypothetical protein